MAYENSWQFDLNRYYSPTSHGDLAKYFMWLLAARLTGKIGNLTQGLWSLHSSSDGLTSGVDSQDRWKLLSPYQTDSAKLKRAEGQAAHSWIVLKSPVIHGSNWYMCMSYNTIDNGSIKMYFSKNAPLGGAINNTPKSIDMWGGVSFTGDLIEYRIGIENLFESQRFHFALSSEGAFLSFNILNNSNKVKSLIAFLPLKENLDLDQYPVYTFIEATYDNSYNLLENGCLGNSLGGLNPSYTGGSNSLYKHQLMNTEDFYLTPNNISLIKFPIVMYSQKLGLPSVLDATKNNNTIPHYRGVLKDVYYIGECPLQNGTSLGDIAGQIEYIKLGQYLFPANSSLTI